MSERQLLLPSPTYYTSALSGGEARKTYSLIKRHNGAGNHT